MVIILDNSNFFVPFISIIIPTRNEEKYISSCLTSLVNQDYPKEKFEVIVIDGLSQDKTVEIVGTYKDKINIRIVNNPKVKQVFSFNCGIKLSKGDYFVILSGHSSVPDNFLRKSVSTYHQIAQTNSKLAAIGGRLHLLSDNFFGKLFSYLFMSPFSGSGSFWRATKAHFAKTVVFGLYYKKFVEEVGYFDEDMLKGQDFELNLRLIKNGFKLYCNPEIMPSYYVRQKFLGFIRQTYDNGVAKGLCIRKRYFNPIWFIPFAFFIYQLVLPFSFLLNNNLLSIIFYVPLIIYWICSFIFSFIIGHLSTQSLLLPFLFWVLHTITGIGLILGLIIGKRCVTL